MAGWGGGGWGGSPWGGGATPPVVTPPVVTPPVVAPTGPTVGNIVYSAYRIAGILSEAQRGYSVSEGQDGLLVLNSLLDAYRAERLMGYTVVRSVVPVKAGKQAYLIGTEDPNFGTWAGTTSEWTDMFQTWEDLSNSPDWLIPRPERIERASYILTRATPSVEVPMRIILGDQEWQDYATKAITSPIPWALYYEPKVPYGVARLYPVPSDASVQIAIYWWATIQQYHNLTDIIFLPPAYLLALELNLAVHLSMRYPTRAKLSPMAVEAANTAMRRIKTMNSPDLQMVCEEALMGSQSRNGGHFNMLSGRRNGY